MLEDTEVQLQPLLEDEEHTTEPIMADTRIPARRVSMRRRWYLGVVLVVIIALVGGSLLYWQLTRPSPVQYTQAQATIDNLSQKISATGPVTAHALYNMNFGTAGQVNEIDVQVGQHVKRGQVLAKLIVDMTALQDTVDQAQISVNDAQVSLAAAQGSLGNALINANNAQAASAAALNVAYDQEQTDLNNCQSARAPANCQQSARDKYMQAQRQADVSDANAQGQVTAAQNQVVTAQGNLDKAKAQLQAAQHSLNNANANANLTAPADATVAAINGAIGQTVGSSGGGASSGGSSSAGTATTGGAASGGSTSTPFLVLTDTGQLGISAQVNEADIGNVQPGQPAQFTVAAYPDTTFRATVAAIDTIGQTTSNVVNYTAHLNVDQSSLNGSHLYPGMTATVNITTAQRIGALLIPSAALSFPSVALQSGEIDRSQIVALLSGGRRGQGQGSGGQSNKRIVLQLHNGKLTPILVTTGLSNGQFTEILSGLNAGDSVVIGQTGGTTPNSTTGSGRNGTGGFGGGFGGGGNGRNAGGGGRNAGGGSGGE